MGVFGTLSLAVDVATLGALSATTQGAKALAKEVGKVAFADIVIAGYGTKYTSEVMRNLGMSPEQVMMTHMVTSLAVGGYSSYKNYKKNLSDIMKNAGLDNIDQAKDLMKYTGLSSKDLAKRLENSSIESILGIDKKNLDYLMNKTNMSEVDILTELKKQNIDIDKINGLNVDEILKKLDKESRPKFDIDIAQQKLNEIRSRMPNQNLKIRGNMAIADVAVEGLPNEFVAHSKIHNLASKGANVDNFSFTRENKFFETYVDDGFPRYNDTEAKILEDIASKIKDPNISGRINLFTELPACQSCTNIIFEFRRRFPNIELNIFTK
ncbi:MULTISPECIES: deaminase domain-containing protein [Erysipelotrichales]|uniref:deaminase domain-containing protein n=2 Tax=Erysipelotrichales TaxID=526525 RepID=UPI00384D4DE3